MWSATLVSNIGTWMYSAASSWLMTALSPEPLIVSLVQMATTFPMFLLAIPAGALTDIVNRRHFLIAVEIVGTALAALFAIIVWLNLVTPLVLLLFTFLISASSVLAAPAWQAIVPSLVPKAALPPAITANSVGFNIARAIGPALGGGIIGLLGIAAPFWINAVSNLAVVGSLLWLRLSTKNESDLPAEHFWGATIAGIRYCRHNAPLIATMIRGGSFFLFAVAYWALLPLVVRQQIEGGAGLYGTILGTIGGGAVAGAFLLPSIKRLLGPDRVIVLGTLGTTLALVLFGMARETPIAYAASGIAGASWIIVLAGLNVSAQVALPDWVRGRGLAVYLTATFGAMTLGSVIWGKSAELIGLPSTFFAATAGLLAAIPLTWRWKLQAGAALDLAPSLYWPPPATAWDVAHDRGPILVTVEYKITPQDKAAFLIALADLKRARLRDGAYSWEIFEDAARPGQFLETFHVASWIEHLRQHERTTMADQPKQLAVAGFQRKGQPIVSHFIAARPGKPPLSGRLSVE